MQNNPSLHLKIQSSFSHSVIVIQSFIHRVFTCSLIHRFTCIAIIIIISLAAVLEVSGIGMTVPMSWSDPIDID
jgi:hypothetical protein